MEAHKNSYRLQASCRQVECNQPCLYVSAPRAKLRACEKMYEPVKPTPAAAVAKLDTPVQQALTVRGNQGSSAGPQHWMANGLTQAACGRRGGGGSGGGTAADNPAMGYRIQSTTGMLSSTHRCSSARS